MLAVVDRIALLKSDPLRFALAVIVGLGWAAAFPKLGIAGFGWLAPGLLLATALGRCGGAAFRIGYVAGLTFFLASLYWLLLIPAKFAPIVGWLALSAFLALYPACWVWLCWKIFPGGFSEHDSAVAGMLDGFLKASRGQRVSWAFACAALWVTWEMIQARLFTGFPWNLLGASQYQMLPVIQIASLTGVYGVSFVMVWFSVSLIGAAASMTRLSARRSSWMLELLPPMVVVALVVSFGMRQLFPAQPVGAELKIALVQPSIPQTTIWDEKEDTARFRKLLMLSETALSARPDVLVWPEAGVPSYARWDTNIFPVITNLVRTHHVWLVLGSDDLALKQQPRHPEDFDFFNSAFLVSPEGEFVASYRKRKLVVFGEYVPLARWLPFLKWFTPISDGFMPGTRAVPFVLPEFKVKLTVLICFEDVFPQFVRQGVEDDTDFLLNLTNNGWFGESAAQWQHAASAVFRAVENGLPLVRCANNGLTCWVDTQGRMHEVTFPNSNDVYGAGCKLARVPTLAGQRRAPTFYRQRGDWLGWSCVGLSAALVAWRFLTQQRMESPPRLETRPGPEIGN